MKRLGEGAVYAPGGFGLSELGDIEVVADGDHLHLFHLTLPSHDVVQHAVSRDGLRWDPMPAALRTGDPGACDDDQIWTMSVAATTTAGGCSTRRSPSRKTERSSGPPSPSRTTSSVGRSRPRTRSPKRTRVGTRPTPTNGAPSPGGTRSRSGWETGGTRWWRPAERSGPLLRRGCVGLLTSADFDRWEVLPPLFAPRRFWDLECPQAFEIGGRWYLTAAVMEDRRQRYWWAPAFGGPWDEPGDDGYLAPVGHYAGRSAAGTGATCFGAGIRLASVRAGRPRRRQWTGLLPAIRTASGWRRRSNSCRDRTARWPVARSPAGLPISRVPSCPQPQPRDALRPCAVDPRRGGGWTAAARWRSWPRPRRPRTA
jgi:hypothetical protein